MRVDSCECDVMLCGLLEYLVSLVDSLLFFGHFSFKLLTRKLFTRALLYSRRELLLPGEALSKTLPR